MIVKHIISALFMSNYFTKHYKEYMKHHPLTKYFMKMFEEIN